MLTFLSVGPGKVGHLQCTCNPQRESISIGWKYPENNAPENKLLRYVLHIKDVNNTDVCVKQVTFSEAGNDKFGDA